MIYLFYILGFITIIATILPIIPNRHWGFKLFEYFLFHIITIGIISLLGISFFSNFIAFDTALLLLIVASILYNSYTVYPYTFMHEKTVKDYKKNISYNSLSILTANVLQTNNNYEDFIKIIKQKNPDIFITMESDLKWQHALSQLESIYSYSIKIPQDNFYGMHVYSKYKILNEKIRFRVEEDVPSVFFQINKNFLVDIFCIHPKPAAPRENTHSIQKDTEILQVAEETQYHENPTFVCGDFNDAPWAKVTSAFKILSGLQDPRIGRGLYATFPAKLKSLRYPLDHVFVSRHFQLMSLQRQPYFGSDHLALYCKLHYTGTGKKLPN